MKLQEASRKEVKRMAIGSCICGVLELAGFFLLHLLGVVRFTYKVVLGAAGGVIAAENAFLNGLPRASGKGGLCLSM